MDGWPGTGIIWAGTGGLAGRQPNRPTSRKEDRTTQDEADILTGRQADKEDRTTNEMQAL
jgi:hypothetical protein